MLRRALIAASESSVLRRVATEVPVARAVATQFVAGESLDDALVVTRDLGDAGLEVTLDHLGEAVTDAAIAEAAADVYRRALQRIDADGLPCSISVKPSQLGVDIDEQLCGRLLRDLADRAAAVGTSVTIDMESSDYTQRTIDLLDGLLDDGHDNVGCAVQSYLHRTLADVEALTARGASLRLCKGAYLEPPEIAYQDRAAVDRNYLTCADAMLDSGAYARFATHDHRLIERIVDETRRRGIGSDRFEFQMLYGVREPLQRQLRDAGFTVRIYVPFGDEWYPYLTRRLAERPANALFFARALVGRLQR